MKRIFNIFFNLSRNISLLIVIGLLLGFTYFEYNDDAAQSIYTSMENVKKGEAKIRDNGAIGLLASTEPSLDIYKSRKLKIATKQGFAYLRHSQIMIINSGSPIVITTTNTDKIEVDLTLSQLEKLLNQNDNFNFFRINSAIINCNYIQQLNKESKRYGGKYIYQNVVVMENGERINISKPKTKELSAILENMTF